MPSTTSSSVSAVLASSAVITPSLPTFCMAWAIIWPIVVSPLAEMVPTCAISSLVETFLERAWRSFTTASTARSTPRLRSIGFMPAATDLAPSRRMSEHGCGRGAVARHGAGLRGHLAHHLRAHVLELVREFDLFGDGDAVLGDAGRAEALVEHDVAALGAERHLNRVGQNIDTAQHLVTRVGREAYVFGSHGLSLLN